MRWLIDFGDVEDFLVVATEIERRLQGDKFRDWINNTIGLIPRINADLPIAISRLNVPVATTNYDDFAADVTQRGAVPWIDRPDIDDWLRGNDRRHLHLHGVWRRPESIILGHTSYSRLTMNERTQFVQKVLGTRRILLIGCGSGLSDPNLGPLLGWLRDEFSGGHRNDYLLCLDQDAHGEGPFVRVPFGPRYSDLATFLNALVPLGAEHQSIVDISQAYKAFTKVPYGSSDTFFEQASALIDAVGQYVHAHASPELYDALEDEEENIGLALGLVKAICITKRHEDLGRVIRVSDRIPYGIQSAHAKSLIVQAFREICPYAADSKLLQQVDRLLVRWVSEEGPASKLIGTIQTVRAEISVNMGRSAIS